MINVFVNGTFDVLHVGHIELIKYAKSLGDYLTIAIDTDRRVRELKGSKRPVNSAYERQVLLSALSYVDKVVIFDTDEELISLIGNVDIMVKGSDYKHKTVIGETNCKKVVYFDRIEPYSTTKKIQHIIDR
jgi:D-beta-D-heptose 7-phosphate kinase/D-beta-D-heptose 1-phosphate adenosyltransferase